MSQENVEIVRAVYEAWNTGDMDAVRQACDPEIIMRGPKGWPEPGPFFGQEAVMRAIEQLRDTFESDWQELNSDLVHVGDRVAVRTVWHGIGHGPELKQESTPVFTVRDGRVFHIEFFWDHAEALETLGLSERAMSQENVEVVWRAVEAFNRGGTEAALAWLAPDVEWHDLPDLPDAEIYRGHGGFLAAFKQFFGELEDYTVKVDETTDHGERVLVFARIIGRGRGSGAWFEQRIFGVWTVRNRLVVRAVWFRTREEALEAVGLSE
jgi:ketosteroid isomerase-like protein